jgi:hypothetical protein
MTGLRVATLAALLALALSPLWSNGPQEASAFSAAPTLSSPFLPTPPLGPPREMVFYGHAKSLARRSGHWELRVDPALFLSGLAAQHAAVEDGAIAPGEAVPNDYYTRDDSHRLLTFRVAPRARVTVMTAGPKATAITVPELAPGARREADAAPALGTPGRVLDPGRGRHGAGNGPAVHAVRGGVP